MNDSDTRHSMNDSDTDSTTDSTTSEESDNGEASPQSEPTYDTVPPPRSPARDVTGTPSPRQPAESPRTAQPTDHPVGVEVDQGQNVPQGKILVTLVERKTIRYFSGNICIKQTDITDTYPVFVPEEWDKAVPCNHGMMKK